MSYILEALKRAERERKQGQVSVLDEVSTEAAAQRSQRRLPPWLWMGLGAAACGALVFAVMAWHHRAGTPQPSAAAQAGAAVATAPAPPPAAQALAAAPASPAPPAAAAPTAATLPPPVAPVPAPSAAAVAPSAVAAPAAATASAAAPAASPAPPPASGGTTAPSATIENPARISSVEDVVSGSTEPATPPPAAVANPAPLPTADNGAAAEAAGTTPESGAAPGTAPPAAADTAMPALREMPDSYRSQFPRITVDVHVYDEDPQRRFVLIDGKRYKEGETLAEGPRIDTIVAEGIVFEWQGRRVLFATSR